MLPNPKDLAVLINIIIRKKHFEAFASDNYFKRTFPVIQTVFLGLALVLASNEPESEKKETIRRFFASDSPYELIIAQATFFFGNRFINLSLDHINRLAQIGKQYSKPKEEIIYRYRSAREYAKSFLNKDFEAMNVSEQRRVEMAYSITMLEDETNDQGKELINAEFVNFQTENYLIPHEILDKYPDLVSTTDSPLDFIIKALKAYAQAPVPDENIGKSI